MSIFDIRDLNVVIMLNSNVFEVINLCKTNCFINDICKTKEFWIQWYTYNNIPYKPNFTINEFIHTAKTITRIIKKLDKYIPDIELINVHFRKIKLIYTYMFTG